MRSVMKSLACVVLVAFSTNAFGVPNWGITLQSVNAKTNNSQDEVIVLTAALGGVFSDTQDCLSIGYFVTSIVAFEVSDPNFRQVYSIALAALLAGKLIDVEISNTGTNSIDCLDVGGYSIPVVTGITVHK